MNEQGTVKLDLLERFMAGEETLNEALSKTTTSPIEYASVTDSGLIKFRCLCNRLHFEELKCVAMKRTCSCGRQFCVPSPVEIPILAGSYRVRQFCEETKQGDRLLWTGYEKAVGTPRFYDSTSTKTVENLTNRTKRRSKITWGIVGVFFFGLSIGVFCIALSAKLQNIILHWR